MSALSVEPPFPAFADDAGQPLEDGYIWIGTVNLNPITNPIVAYWDSALTIPAVQPIRTSGGYPVYQGTPANIYVNSDYSIQVQNKNGSVVYSAPSATERYNAVVLSITGDDIPFIQPLTGAVATTVQDKLERVVNVFDFMTQAQINGVTGVTAAVDCTNAIQAALDCVPNGANSYAPSKTSGGAGRVRIFFPNGLYLVSATLDCSQRDYVQLVSDGRAIIFSSAANYIIDMSSTDHCVVSSIYFQSFTARVGIYIDRCTTAPYAQFNVYENVVVYLGSNITANSGLGRVGIWNGRGELNVFSNVEVRADLCMYATKFPDANFPPTTGILQTAFVTSVQNTYDSCKWISWTAHAPTIVLNGAIAHEFYANYWACSNIASGTAPYAIINYGATACKLTGTVESLPSFMLVQQFITYDNYISLAFQNNFDGRGIVQCEDVAATVGFNNGYVQISTSGVIPAGTCVIKGSVASLANQINGNIVKSLSSIPGIIAPAGQALANIIQNEAPRVQINQQSINTTFGTTFSGASLSNASTNENFVQLYGSPDNVGVQYARVFSGRDTTGGASTYASFLAFYTEDKASGTTDTSTEKGRFQYNGTFRPATDNTQQLGNASFRWSEVFAGNGTINTSDGREKEALEDGIDSALLRAWGKVKYSQFKFKDAIAKKGDGARWHIGLIAQQVKAAFESEGLDAFAYGLLCYDAWEDQWDENIVVNEVLEKNLETGVEEVKIVEETVRKLVVSAGNRYGIRYEEALALECAYLRSKLTQGA